MTGEEFAKFIKDVDFSPAREVRDRGLLRIREAFHEKWKSVIKCSRCGISYPKIAFDAGLGEAVAHSRTHCGGAALLDHGYSWVRS